MLLENGSVTVLVWSFGTLCLGVGSYAVSMLSADGLFFAWGFLRGMRADKTLDALSSRSAWFWSVSPLKRYKFPSPHFGPQISPLFDTCAYSPFGLRTGHGTIPKRSGSLLLRLQLCSAHELEN